MQTHHDAEHQDRKARELAEKMRDLNDEADRMTEAQENIITAGEEGETPIASWGRFGVVVTEFPVLERDQPLDIVRLSLGSVKDDTAYCVFRGDRDRLISLLGAAKNALRRKPIDG